LRYILLVFVLIVSLHAEGFKRVVLINPTMPTQTIATMLSNAKDGTVFEFKGGEYSFNNKVIVENKNSIAIRASKGENVIFKDNLLFFQNTTVLKIQGIHFENNSGIVLGKVDKFYFTDLSFYNSAISINGSKGFINKSYFKTKNGAKWTSLYITNSSIVKLEELDIENDSNVYTIDVLNKSKVALLNSKIISLKTIGLLDGNNSKVIVENSTFDGVTPQSNYKKYPFQRALDVDSDSQLIAVGNTFRNYDKDIFLSHSIALIGDNNFINSKFGVSAFKFSNITIKNNKFTSNNISLYLNSSYVGSSNNIFDNSKVGISAYNYARINIENDEFNNIPRSKSIIVSKYSAINLGRVTGSAVKNNEYGEVSKNSKIYSRYGYTWISLPGIGDPQVQNNPIDFTVGKVDFSGVDFSEIKSIQINFSLSAHLLKGYTQEAIEFWNNEGENELIEKNTYVIFDLDTNRIIEPLEYRGVQLKNIPQLSFTKSQRKIELNPIVITKDNKKYISFVIKSNFVLKDIIFNNLPLDILVYKPKSYTTASTRIRELHYPLLINGDDFTLKYECSIVANQAECKQEVKGSL